MRLARQVQLKDNLNLSATTKLLPWVSMLDNLVQASSVIVIFSMIRTCQVRHDYQLFLPI